MKTIPFDLIIEILTRLPAKSIARFRCVSKLCGSIFRSSNFTESFFTISSFRPKLLFTCLVNRKTLFFSSPQPQSSSSTLTVDSHMSLPMDCTFDICRPVHGLVCGKSQRTVKGTIYFDFLVTVPLICNPSTGQFLTLPEVETMSKFVMSYLGYDPIEKQFKVLCMTSLLLLYDKCRVLTLGTGEKLSWRTIKCDIPHFPLYDDSGRVGQCAYDGICINGVLYYFAKLREKYEFPDIVCFDIRFEKFNCIISAYYMQGNFRGRVNSTLVNYKGKLAMLRPNTVARLCIGIKLWVLEDAEKHEWSCFAYFLPPPWKNIYAEKKLRLVGTTSRGKIVFSPYCRSDSFYLLYYYPERNTITRVEIQGMEAFKPHQVYTFNSRPCRRCEAYVDYGLLTHLSLCLSDFFVCDVHFFLNGSYTYVLKLKSKYMVI